MFDFSADPTITPLAHSSSRSPADWERRRTRLVIFALPFRLRRPVLASQHAQHDLQRHVIDDARSLFQGAAEDVG
jgi:hypothetical protein